MKKYSRIKYGAAGFLAGIFLLGMSGWAGAAQEDAVISKGVLIEGIDVSGMTIEQASAAVEEKAAQMGETMATLTIGDNQVTATLNQLGLEWENRQILDEVKNLGTTEILYSGTRIRRTWNTRIKNTGLTLPQMIKSAAALWKAAAFTIRSR